MSKRILLKGLLILSCIAPAMALAADATTKADATGKWSGEMGGPNGGMVLTAELKQDGTKLTGIMGGPGGEPMPIQDGKVEGEKIVFSVAFNGMKIVHEGTIKGDTISLQIKMDAGAGGDSPGPLTLKRVK